MKICVTVRLVCATLLFVIYGTSVVSSEDILRSSSSRPAKKTTLETVFYTYGFTIAEICRSPLDRSLQYCKLKEVHNEAVCEEELQKLHAQGRPVRNICYKKMMSLINECMELKNEEVLSDGRNIGDDTGLVTGFLNGILPGTKWCGMKDLARDYFDLGSRYELDKCCRAHDHCPIKVPALHHFSNFKFNFYTASHCDCDIDFYNCLTALNSSVADTVGDMYFNIFKVNCLREAPGTNICPNLTQSKNNNCQSAHLIENVDFDLLSPEIIYPVKKTATSSKPPH